MGVACTSGQKSPVSPGGEGTLIRNLSSEPELLHPIRSTDLYASIIQGFVVDSLLQRDADTYQLKPHLAQKWEVPQDGSSFTFTLREGVKFHDGRPLTAQDVAFSFKAFTDPSYGGIHVLPYFENIKSVEVLSPLKVRFHTRKKYFRNLSALGTTLQIIPRHIYQDKNKKLSKTLMGSGPYIFKAYQPGKFIVLEQNPHWWGRVSKPQHHRIKKIMFRFIKDENDQLLRMASGRFDFLGLSAEAFMKKTSKPPWGTELTKKEVSNKEPVGYNYIGWNLKNPLFQNKKTRKALAMLMNRPLMNEKFQYNRHKLATGPWYSWNEYANPSVPPVPFDPARARRLLKEAGWQDTDKNGVLEQTLNGQKQELEFVLLFSNKDYEKYLTLYKEELKKSGIKMSLRLMDWAAFLKLIHERKFAAVCLGWSGGVVDIDPKQVWHSDSAREMGSNFIHYSNPEVDALIDRGRAELNRQKRIKLFRKVYRLIAEDYPYVFLFNPPVQFYAISKKVKIPRDTYTYELGGRFWQVTY